MDDSPLGRLPAELRNHIYELAVLHDKPIVLDPNRNAAYKPRPRGSISGLLTALLYTCKTIHTEALPIFYGVNTFEIRVSAGDAQGMLKYLTPTTTEPRNVTLLRRLRVDIGSLTGVVHHRGVACLTRLLKTCRSPPAGLRKCHISIVFWAMARVVFWPDGGHVKDFNYLRLRIRPTTMHASISAYLTRLAGEGAKCQRALNAERSQPVTPLWNIRCDTLVRVIGRLDGLSEMLQDVLFEIGGDNRGGK